MIVLATDPSLSAFGYSVVNTATNEILAAGCIKTEPSKPVTKSDTDRLTSITRILHNLCLKYGVQEIWSETVVGSKSSQAAKALHLCKGVLIGLAVAISAPIKFCPPQSPKMKVCGSKVATKAEMIAGVLQQLQNSSTVLTGQPLYKQSAIADALAVFLYFSDGTRANTSKN